MSDAKKKKKEWIQSYSGRKVTPFDLQPDQVCFQDIAHTLSQKVRFNGHLRSMGYTVGQHCCLGAEQIFLRTRSETLALAFLLHEVSEVVLPDVPTPIKRMIKVDIGGELISWSELEDRHAKAIFEGLAMPGLLPEIYSPEVKEMDARMLMTEKRDLASKEPEPWGISAEPLENLKIDVWSMGYTKEVFSLLYDNLTRERPMKHWPNTLFSNWKDLSRPAVKP